jgi:hypothetical protein
MKLFAVIIMLALIIQSRCQHEKEVRMGQNIDANLIVIFTKKAGHKEIEEFKEETIGRKIPGMDGTAPKKGIGAVLSLPMLCPDREGVAIDLREDITTGELEEIRAAIRASAIVESIEENISPKKINCSNLTK